jgi:hypothetical protein
MAFLEFLTKWSWKQAAERWQVRCTLSPSHRRLAVVCGKSIFLGAEVKILGISLSTAETESSLNGVTNQPKKRREKLGGIARPPRFGCERQMSITRSKACGCEKSLHTWSSG